MRDSNGDITPLCRLVTLALVLIFLGIVVAMIFGDNEKVTQKIEEYKNKDNIVQTEKNKS